MKSSRFDGGRFVQGVVLFGFSVYLIKLFETGDIHRLVSPNIALLLKITLGVLLVMMFYALGTIFRKTKVCDHGHHHHVHHHAHGASCNHDHNPRPRKRLLLLVAPIILGLCLPTQSLGSSMLNNSLRAKMALNYLATAKQQPEKLKTTKSDPANKTVPSSGSTTSSNVVDLTKIPKQPSLNGKQPPKPTPGGDLSLLDLFNNLMVAPENYYNQRFTYTGFVYHPPGWPTNRLVLTRYLITCCTADATPIGVTVESNDAAKYADDTWLKITGPLSARNISDAGDLLPLNWYYGSDLMPTILAQSMKTIPEPTDPYLYPTNKSATLAPNTSASKSTTTGGK